MATKNTAAGFEFLVEALKANKSAQYGDLKQQAEAKGLTVYPVMFGRAKSMLGLAKPAKRGAGKKAAKTAHEGRKASASAGTGKRRPGRPAGGSESKSGRIRELLGSGMTAAEIAKKVGCTAALVYNVKSTAGKSTRRAAMRRTPGRPRKAASEGANGSVESVLEAL